MSVLCALVKRNNWTEEMRPRTTTNCYKSYFLRLYRTRLFLIQFFGDKAKTFALYAGWKNTIGLAANY